MDLDGLADEVDNRLTTMQTEQANEADPKQRWELIGENNRKEEVDSKEGRVVNIGLFFPPDTLMTALKKKCDAQEGGHVSVDALEAIRKKIKRNGLSCPDLISMSTALLRVYLCVCCSVACVEQASAAYLCPVHKSRAVAFRRLVSAPNPAAWVRLRGRAMGGIVAPVAPGDW